MSGRLKRWFAKAPAVAVVLGAMLLPISQPASAGEFIVTYTTPDGPPEINRMHTWILYVESESGDPIEGADIEVDGGMPAHDHGLPTRPQVTQDLGDGYYRLDGVRFHMSGYWEIVIQIRSDESEDTVVIVLTL